MNTIINRLGIKKVILFVLVFSMFTMAFGTVLAPEADAASKYKVKSWRTGQFYCYYIYTGKLPEYYNSTFYRGTWDQYKSGSLKINFYTQGEYANYEMVDAMLRQIGKTSKQSYTYNYNYGDDIYYPYIILGWYFEKESVNKLIKSSPFINNQGVSLYIDKIGKGNVVADHRYDYEYSWVEYYEKDNITIGYRFVDEDGYIWDRHGEYFPYLY